MKNKFANVPCVTSGFEWNGQKKKTFTEIEQRQINKKTNIQIDLKKTIGEIEHRKIDKSKNRQIDK